MTAFFGEYDKTIAQILLSGEDIERADQKENPVNTFEILLQMGVSPIVNESDSVSHTEIEPKEQLFSDNDGLSGFVAVLCHAEKPIILSGIDGIYDSDPAPIPPPNAFWPSPILTKPPLRRQVMRPVAARAA